MIDPIVRANEWKRLWEGDDGLKQAFDHIRMSYFKRAGLIEPWEGDKLNKLALAGRILDMVEEHAQAVIDTGKIAADQEDRTKKLAELPERKKKWLNI